MKCPIDEIQLQMTERQGVEIDYCPKCRGIWLDRGELDKILDKMQIENSTATSKDNSAAPMPDMAQYPQPPYYGKHGGYSKHGGYGQRRKGLLGELFDF